MEPASRADRPSGGGGGGPVRRPVPPGRPGGHRRGRYRPPGHHRPSEIPIARGLGSSAALAVAAAAAAGAEDPWPVAAQMDGHPDNAAASMVGGLVAAARVKGGVHAVRLAPRCQPGLRGHRARRAPVHGTGPAGPSAEVSRESAAFNLSRMALLIAGLADSRLLIRRGHRGPTAPGLSEPPLSGGAQAAGRAGRGRCARRVLVRRRSLPPGHLPGCGAPKVQAAGEVGLADAGIPGQVLLLHPDMHGLIVDRDGSADVYDFTRPVVGTRNRFLGERADQGAVSRGQHPSGP